MEFEFHSGSKSLEPVVYRAKLIDGVLTAFKDIAILVACEYLDIFFWRVSWVASREEVKFAICLIPGTMPVSKISFQVGPVKLAEVKK